MALTWTDKQGNLRQVGTGAILRPAAHAVSSMVPHAPVLTAPHQAVSSVGQVTGGSAPVSPASAMTAAVGQAYGSAAPTPAPGHPASVPTTGQASGHGPIPQYLNAMIKGHQGRVLASNYSGTALDALLNNGLNRQARISYGATNGPGAAPTTNSTTALNDQGYYFNPLSDTLWSQRVKNPDGTFSDVLNANLPTDLDNASYLDSAGGLPPGVNAKDAAFYSQAHGLSYQLQNALREPRSQIDKLNAVNPLTHMTLAQQYGKDAQDGFIKSSDAAMSSLAARGLYDSGMRGTTGADLAKQLSDAQQAVSDQYGANAMSNAQHSLTDTRSNYANQIMSLLSDNSNRLNSLKIQNALGGN